MISCHGAASSGPYKLRCERFTGDDGSLFLFEVFEEMPSVVKGVSDGGSADLLFDSGVIDLIDAGIVIYDRENRLVYCNARFVEFYSDFNLQLKPGTRLETLMEAVYFSSGYRSVKSDDPDYQAWLQKQLRDFPALSRKGGAVCRWPLGAYGQQAAGKRHAGGASRRCDGVQGA